MRNKKTREMNIKNSRVFLFVFHQYQLAIRRFLAHSRLAYVVEFLFDLILIFFFANYKFLNQQTQYGNAFIQCLTEYWNVSFFFRLPFLCFFFTMKFGILIEQNTHMLALTPLGIYRRYSTNTLTMTTLFSVHKPSFQISKTCAIKNSKQRCDRDRSAAFCFYYAYSYECFNNVSTKTERRTNHLAIDIGRNDRDTLNRYMWCMWHQPFSGGIDDPFVYSTIRFIRQQLNRLLLVCEWTHWGAYNIHNATGKIRISIRFGTATSQASLPFWVT